MSVLDKLACALNRRDEEPNTALAVAITKRNDKESIRELVENLKHKKKDIQHDCIKVLYEIGELKPALISHYAHIFIELLSSKNNRMQWGAMHAVDAITLEDPKTIYSSLTKIIDSADKGTVITRDHAVRILVKLCSIKSYYNNSFDLLIEQLKRCPDNQLPMYAENSFHIVNEKNKNNYLKSLSGRLVGIKSETKKKRVEKVIKKVREQGK